MEEHDLSYMEYIVLERINLLCWSEKYNNFCTMSKENLAKDCKLSKQHLHRIINTLIEKDLLFRDEKTKFLKPTELWKKTLAYEKDNIKKS